MFKQIRFKLTVPRGVRLQENLPLFASTELTEMPERRHDRANNLCSCRKFGLYHRTDKLFGFWATLNRSRDLQEFVTRNHARLLTG
jgi:hypothetical protein